MFDFMFASCGMISTSVTYASKDLVQGDRIVAEEVFALGGKESILQIELFQFFCNTVNSSEDGES